MSSGGIFLSAAITEMCLVMHSSIGGNYRDVFSGGIVLPAAIAEMCLVVT